MKIALLFFGQPRFLSNKKSYNSHRSFLSKYDVDIFVHSWWSIEPNDYTPSSWSSLSHVPYDRDTIKTIRNLYNPVHAVYEKQKEFDVDESVINKVEFIKSRQDLNNIKSHLYSIKRVGEVLKEYTSSNDYSFIILSRFDNIISGFPNLESLDPGFYKMEDHPGLADQLFIFSPEYMEFLNVYDNYDELNNKGGDYILEKLKLIHYETLFPDKPMLKTNINLTLARSCE